MFEEIWDGLESRNATRQQFIFSPGCGIVDNSSRFQHKGAKFRGLP